MNIKKIFVDGLENIQSDIFRGSEINLENFIYNNKKEILEILDDKIIQAEVSKTINFLQLNKKDFLLSLVYLNLFCEKFPNNFDLRLITSKTYFQCDLYEMALININLIPQKIYTVEHYQILINIYFKLDQFNECVETIKKIRLIENINSTNTLILINCLRRLKKINEARLELENLRKFHQNDFEFFYNETLIELLENKFDFVIEKLNKNINNYSHKEIRFHELYSFVLSKFRNFIEAITQVSIADDLGSKNFISSVYNLYFCINDFKNGYLYLEKATTDIFKEKFFYSHNFKKWNFENLDESILFVYTGKGVALGDKIYFYRYLLDIKDRFKSSKIYLVSNNHRDKYIFNNKNINFLKFDEIKKIIDEDRKTYFTSMPIIARMYYEKLSMNKIKSIDFLPYDKERKTLWENFVKNFKSKIKVGINWKGNIQYKYDAYRSIDINKLESIFNNKNITYFILNNQVNAYEKKFLSKFENVILIDKAKFEFENQNAFSDTIELMRSLDLIISTDTAIAHIASALKLKTYLMLEYSPFWYFAGDLEGNVYQNFNLRYFNQDKPGDWDSVIKMVEIEIKKL